MWSAVVSGAVASVTELRNNILSCSSDEEINADRRENRRGLAQSLASKSPHDYQYDDYQDACSPAIVTKPTPLHLSSSSPVSSTTSLSSPSTSTFTSPTSSRRSLYSSLPTIPDLEWETTGGSHESSQPEEIIFSDIQQQQKKNKTHDDTDEDHLTRLRMQVSTLQQRLYQHDRLSAASAAAGLPRIGGEEEDDDSSFQDVDMESGGGQPITTTTVPLSRNILDSDDEDDDPTFGDYEDDYDVFPSQVYPSNVTGRGSSEQQASSANTPAGTRTGNNDVEASFNDDTEGLFDTSHSKDDDPAFPSEQETPPVPTAEGQSSSSVVRYSRARRSERRKFYVKLLVIGSASILIAIIILSISLSKNNNNDSSSSTSDAATPPPPWDAPIDFTTCKSVLWTSLGQVIGGDSTSSSSSSTTSTSGGGNDAVALGMSVSLSVTGQRLAIGGPPAISVGSSLSTASTNSAGGVVQLYQYENDSSTGAAWKQIGTNITVEGDIISGNTIGASVALSGDGTQAVIGGTGPWGEYFRLVRVDNDDWRVIGGDLGTDTTVRNSLQSSGAVVMSSDGSALAVGDPGYDQGTGQVRVYRIPPGGGLTQLGNTLQGESEFELFGSSLAMSADGSILVVGSPQKTVNSLPRAGQVRVFKLVENTWVLFGQELNGKNKRDQFGYSVALSADGSILAVGARFANVAGIVDAGVVESYVQRNGQWVELSLNQLAGNQPGGAFGQSVALSANGWILAVGAPYTYTVAENAGQVQVYRWNGTDWNPVGQQFAGNGAAYFMGQSVSLSADGSILAIGAAGMSLEGVVSGHVVVWKAQCLD